jgi:hypothetical protein
MKIYIWIISLMNIIFISYKSYERIDPISAKKTMSIDVKVAEENWYICYNCCKTKKSKETPWENGCRQSSSGTHNYWFCGKAGDFNYTCRKCDAEVYLTSSTSPCGSKCCATGGTHTWYHR